MSILQPYIDGGKLVIRSGQTGMDKVSTLRWDGAVAQARMDNLLSAFYSTERVDAVLVITSYSIHYTKLYDIQINIRRLFDQTIVSNYRNFHIRCLLQYV